MVEVRFMALENWKTRRQDKKTEEHWNRIAAERPLNGHEEYQREWNFIEADYDWKPSSNKLMGHDGVEFYPQYGSAGFAFETSLVKYLVPKIATIEDGVIVSVRHAE